MALSESRYAVWLGDRMVGHIHQKGDYTWFALAEEYLADPLRPVLGLVFEQDLTARHAAALRLPPWFSNLLPEGPLRQWIATDRGVSPDREMELLTQVGHDLPGAVRVLPDDDHRVPDDGWRPPRLTDDPGAGEIPGGWRFSLAGVGLKFSMLRVDDRLTLPAFGEGGDWIVKLPDPTYPDVPLNEYAMMSLAGAAGVDVPPVRLVHRDQVVGLPPRVWARGEELAYAVRRFDRDEHRRGIHIEDLAQVRNIYPEQKYAGNYETLAAHLYRYRDIEALREFARRLAFVILISDGDAHLKNWSLIYRDPRNPTLSPAYDLVATAMYRDAAAGEETLGLKFGGTRRFDQVSVATFGRLERRLGCSNADLPGVVTEVVDRVVDAWPRVADLLRNNDHLGAAVAASIDAHRSSLLKP